MKSVHHFAIFFAGLIVSVQGIGATVPESYPITIMCSDKDAMPDETLTVDLAPLKNLAVLKYKASGSTSPLEVAVTDVYGINSSGNVTIDSRPTDILFKKTKLTINASSNVVMRVTRSTAFTISFLLDEETGKITPKTVMYYDGVLEFDGIEPKFIDLSKRELSCKIQGL
ncbi:MAG TPA: hypothetical protein VEL47_03140 [Myxococcota bacterium]|nr:hypothetical protein [Myxococcota bacterium]